MRKPIRILGRVLLACIALLMLIAGMSIVSGLYSPAHAQALSSAPKSAPSSTGAHQDVNRVVAVVNQEVITEYELAAHLRLIRYRMQQSLLASKNASKDTSPASVLPPEDILQKQVLEHLVLQRVQLQKAQEEGIAATDEAATLALEKLAHSENLSVAAYRQKLEAAGFSWLTIQQDIKNDLSIEALRQKEVDQKVKVSQADIERYMANPGSAAELAQAAGLAVAIPAEQVHVRHILIRINNTTSEKTAREKLIALRKKILAGAHFSDIARAFSQDGSASRGGDLGWIYLRDTVPEFAQAANALQDNTMSGPVRTEYGYHLIQVLGRRTADKKEGESARQRDIARQLIGMHKAERTYAVWLRELRDSATIQYKLYTLPVASKN